MRKSIRNILLTFLAACALNIGTMCVREDKEKSEVYEYAVKQNINQEIAEMLEERIGKEIKPNYHEFIDTISLYPENLQKICINSDILDNKHISTEELRNTKKATLKGIENPAEMHAVMANGSGPGNSNRYSLTNSVYSMLNVISFYKFLKDNNVNEENMFMFLSNPAELNLIETEEYKSLLEKRLMTVKDNLIIPSEITLSRVLPSEQEYNEIKNKIRGDATIKNFSNAIRDLSSDYNDIVCIMFSDPSGKDDYIEKIAGRNNASVEFNKKIMSNLDLSMILTSQNFKSGKNIIFQNSRYASKIIPLLERTNPYLTNEGVNMLKNTLGICSANINGLNNEIFTLDFISKYLEDPKQSIKNIMQKLKKIREGDMYLPEIYIFNNGNISAEQYPGFYRPFLDIK